MYSNKNESRHYKLILALTIALNLLAMWTDANAQLFRHLGRRQTRAAPEPPALADGRGLFSTVPPQIVLGDDDRRFCHGSIIGDVAFSHSGDYLASGAMDGSVVIWSWPEGTVCRRLKASDRPVRSVEFSFDDRLLLVHHYASESVDRPLPGHHYAPDGEDWYQVRKYQIRKGGAAHIWAWRQGKQLGGRDPFAQGVWAVQFFPKDNRIAIARDDQTIRVIDAFSKRQLFQCEDVYGWIGSLAISNDGKRLFTCSASWVRWLNSPGITCETACFQAWQVGQPQELLRWSWKHRELKDPPFPLGHTAFLTKVAVSPTREEVAIACSDGIVRICNIDTRRVTPVAYESDNFVYDVCFSPDGSVVALAGLAGKDSEIVLASVQDGHVIRKIWTGEGQAEKLAFSRDGKHIATLAGYTDTPLPGIPKVQGSHRVQLWPVRKKMSHSLFEKFSDAASKKDASHERRPLRH